MFSLVHGNIFDASGNFSYAQCISSDTSSGMFRGIAVDFLSHFPELEVLRSYDMSNTVGKAVPVDIGGKVRLQFSLQNKVLWETNDIDDGKLP